MKKLTLTLLLLVTTLLASAQKPVVVSHEVTVDGSEIVVEYIAEIADGYYMYSTDIPTGGPQPTRLRIVEIEGAELVGNLVPVDEPSTKYESSFNMNVAYFEEYAVFAQRFKVLAEDFVIKGRFSYQSCGSLGCVPGSYDFEVTGDEVKVTPAVVADETPASKSEQAAPKSEQAASKAEPVALKSEPVAPKSEQVAPKVEQATPKSEPVAPKTEPAAPKAEAPRAETVAPKAEAPKADAPVVEQPVNAASETVVEPVDGEAGAAVPATPVTSGNEPAEAEIGEIDPWAPVDMNSGETDNSIWTIFILGFGGGLLALFTPCVWPIIPMTVSFFLKRSKERTQAVREAFIYGASIVVIYLLLGLAVTLLFGPTALNVLATNAYFNIFFFLMLVVFGASFLGGFELKLPSSWTNKVDTKASSTTGMLSIFLMAFTLALVSFSCTGPIIGFLLVEAATSGDIFGPAVGMFGFALALALPFTIFAIFPSLLKQTPRSGGWMNTIKVVLGFVELAFALKFLSVADLTEGWGILDRETFLALWIVLFTLLGLYLLKIIRLPHDDPEDKKASVTGFFGALVSLAFAVYMIPGLWGAPCKAISAFAPPMWTQDFSLYEKEFTPDTYDYDEAIRMSREQNKPVFIDFTGHGCVNCREMEASVLTDGNVLDMLEENFIVVSLYVDDRTELPEPFVGKDGNTYYDIGEKWSHLQQYKFGALSQPYYVVVDANGMPMSGSFAFDKNVADFLDFLEDGLENFNK